MRKERFEDFEHEREGAALGARIATGDTCYRPRVLPVLPQRDEDPRGRADGLARARDELQYAWDRPAGIAMARSIPKRLGFPLGVIAQVAKAEAELLANRAAARIAEGLRGIADDAQSTIASCTALYALLSPPPVATVLDDRAFAWQRVGGANPFVLQRIDRVPDHFSVTPATFARVTSGDSLASAGADGRLYLADYAMLEGLPAGATASGVVRYFCAPLALFVREAKGRALMPVAIQCAQTPPATVFTPSDGTAWEMARLAVQVADANVEESFQHLGRAHFLIEAFALAAERQLSVRHPLYVVLSPHFHGTLAINDAAREKLVVPGGQLDQLLAPSLEGSLALVRKGLATFDLSTGGFADDIHARGLDDMSALPEHPFRDDGLRIDTAIRLFVREYVELAYDADAMVAGDPELRAFVEELRSNQGGRLSGVPARIETIPALANLISFVLFTTSAHHAALNYTQADFMGWAPNMPTAAFSPPPRGVELDDPSAAWSAALPPHGLASAQLEFMWQQSQIRDDRLGHYPAGHFADPRVAPLLERFQETLASADAVIAEQDTSRFLPYPYLRPSLLTASIHI